MAFLQIISHIFIKFCTLNFS